MSKPKNFQTLKSHAAYRPAGSMTLTEAIELVRQGIAFARDQEISRLLINTTDITGYGDLGTLERFQIADAWAKEANLSVIIALTARPDQIDPNRFGIAVARNRGLHSEIFTSENEALAWLLAQRPILS